MILIPTDLKTYKLIEAEASRLGMTMEDYLHDLLAKSAGNKCECVDSEANGNR